MGKFLHRGLIAAALLGLASGVLAEGINSGKGALADGINAGVVVGVDGIANPTGAGGGGGGGGPFTGMADQVANPLICWSLRACSAADRGNKIANVCNSTGGVDVGCADMLSDATSGKLVAATISGIPCPGANCTVKTLYDQSGALSCSGGVACDVTQATVALRPTLAANCIGTLPCMKFVAASSQELIGVHQLNAVTNQPFTFSYVAARTGAFTTQATVACTRCGTNQILFTTSANTAGMFDGQAGGVQTASAPDNSCGGSVTCQTHSFQAVYNDAVQSLFFIDGTTTNTALGGSSQTGLVIAVGSATGASFMNGNIYEVGVWPVAFSGTNNTNMCHNQFTFWGFSTSC